MSEFAKSMFGGRSIEQIQADAAETLRSIDARAPFRSFRVTREGSYTEVQLYPTNDADQKKLLTGT